MEVPHLEDVVAHTCLRRGSSQSRSQSPKRLKASTTSMIAAPGITASHHALAMWLRPSATIWPHDGVGGGMPAPRKLSEASTMMTKPMCSVSRTMNVFMTFGTMWTSMILKLEQPCTRASDTKSRAPHAEDLAAHHAREPRPDDHGDRDHDGPEPRAEAHREEQRDQDRGERERGVDHPHEDRVDAPAEVAGDDADREPDEAAREQRERGDGEAHASAVHEAAEQIAAEQVGAEEMLGAPALLPRRAASACPAATARWGSAAR